MASHPASAVAAPPPAPLVIADGTLEALKWLALLLMTLDHINTFLFERKLPGVYQTARVVMPVFAFVLGYNLARPGAGGAAALRTMRRLLIYGAIATPVFATLVGAWQPLNILFTLLGAVGTIYLLQRGAAWSDIAAALLFAAAGTFVEYWWFGLLACMLAWAYCREPTPGRLIAWVGATATLGVANGNLWALAAVPLLLLAPHVDLAVPRWKHWFYAYYPAHLAVLLAIKKGWF